MFTEFYIINSYESPENGKSASNILWTLVA